jgi:hypothetical protein
MTSRFSPTVLSIPNAAAVDTRFSLAWQRADVTLTSSRL